MKPKNTKNPGENFNKLSHPLQDFHSIDWSKKIKSMGLSLSGSDGVVFIETQQGSVVFKATDEVPKDLFVSQLADMLSVRSPKMRVVSHSCKEFREMMRSMEKYSHNDPMLYEIIRRRLNRPYYQLIEYVPSISLSSVGPSRFEVIFESQENLEEIGRIIGFDLLLNNSDRLHVCWDTEGNIDNILFPIVIPPGQLIDEATIIRDRNNTSALRIQGPCIIDTRTTIVDPNNKFAKPHFQAHLARVKNFLNHIFKFLSQEVLAPQEEQIQDGDFPDQPIKITDHAKFEEFTNINRQFQLFTESVFGHEQIAFICFGVVKVLDQFLNGVTPDGVQNLIRSLKKHGGEWEEQHWNLVIDKIYPEYFSEISKLIKAIWTVYEETVAKVLTASPQKSALARPIQIPLTQEQPAKTERTEIQPFPLSQLTDIKQDPQEKVNPSGTVVENKSLSQSQVSEKPIQQPANSIVEPIPGVEDKKEQPGLGLSENFVETKQDVQKNGKPKYELGYSKLQEKLQKFRQNNKAKPHINS